MMLGKSATVLSESIKEKNGLDPMRQVPGFRSYLIIGNGRVARHFAQYFRLCSLPFDTWSRSDGASAQTLEDKIAASSHVLLAISDRSIVPFFEAHENVLHEKTTLHFSGMISDPRIIGAHPLMTFADADNLYDLETYRKIAFVVEKNRASNDRTFDEILPRLTNLSHSIASEKKALYHALCVMTGNFTVMLWEFARLHMQNHVGIDSTVLTPYLQQTATNLARQSATSVLTGPIARGDHATVAAHLAALEQTEDCLAAADLYRSFVAFHSSETQRSTAQMQAVTTRRHT
jgi:hypothetical protein